MLSVPMSWGLRRLSAAILTNPTTLAATPAGSAGNLFINPADPAGVAANVVGFVKIAADSRLKPQLIGTESIKGNDCYHIRVVVDPYVANSVLNGAGSTLGSGQLDLWIMHD